MLAVLECGHTKSVPDCCEVGTTTSCEECGEKMWADWLDAISFKYEAT